MSEAEWTVTAQNDLARWDDYYRARDGDFADRSGWAALMASRFLAEHPHAGPIATELTRKWRVRGFDAILVYRIVPTGVEILRFHHVREDWRRPT